MKRTFACIALAVLLLAVPVIAGAQEDGEIRLIVRGDDMGMTQGSLVAFEQAFNHGVMPART